jgi:hypothetical protein
VDLRAKTPPPDREAAIRAAMAAYKLDANAAARKQATPPNDNPVARRQALVADTSKATGLGEAELKQLFAKYDRGGGGLAPGELEAVHAAAHSYGLIEGVAARLGGGLKSLTEDVGKVARFGIDVTAKIDRVGLDLGAAALEMAGAKGAAARVRTDADHMVDFADKIGEEAQLFTEGVGAAFRDTITGVAGMIAHPITTIESIVHLVAHPSDIPVVAKALWNTATEKGVAYGIGYVAGNIVPALLTGGSAEGASIGARVVAVAGRSKILTGTVRVASESRFVVGAGKLVAEHSQVIATFAKTSEVGKSAVAVYQKVSVIGSRALKFTNVPREFAGRIIGHSETLQKTVAALKNAASFVGESPAVRAVKRLQAATEDHLVNLRNHVDGAFRHGIERIEGEGGLGEGLAKRLTKTEERSSRAVLVDRQNFVPKPLSAHEQAVLAKRGLTREQVNTANAEGLGKHANAAEDELLSRKSLEIYNDAAGSLQRVGDKQVKDGIIYEGARPMGALPNVRVNYKNPKLNAALQQARALRDLPLSAQEKLDRVIDMVRGERGQPGLLTAASTNGEWDAKFNQINAKLAGAKFHLEELDTYLDAGVGDCRTFALTAQTLLQEALPDLAPRVVYTKTFERVANGVTEGVNHAFNVVTLEGQDVVFDSILPHFTGGTVAQYVNEGLFGRQVRFMDDRFKTLEGRWSTGSHSLSNFQRLTDNVVQAEQQQGLM